MLCDNILPNLIEYYLIDYLPNLDRLYSDVKITYNTKMIYIMVSFSVYYNSNFIDRVPYKHKNWKLHSILQISVQISIFSPHMQKVAFSA